MKKIPSYPKITAKTNITVTQTQNININSPKATALKKGFKQEHRKIKQHPQVLRNQSSTTLLKNDLKHHQPVRKSSKKIIKESEYQKSVKNSKSQKQLALLSEKLKRLQEKIKVIKAKQRKQKHSSISNRSMSRNRQTSSYVKKQNVSSRKDLQLYKKLPRNQSTKILKKSYSDKLGIRLPQSTKNKSNKNVNSQMQNDKNSQHIKSQQKQEHQRQVLHQFLTQVPNKHPDAHLKQGVSESLKNRTYEMSQSESQEYDEDEAYYIGKAEKSLRKPNLYSIRQHIFQSLQTMQFLQNIRRPTVAEMNKKGIPFPNHKLPYTIILDLDETLIHCNESLNIPHDIKLTIKFPTNQKIDAGVNIRPYALQFLQKLSQFAEIIVFTASHECYANVVLDYLDPQKKYISQRLFRQHCWQTEQGIYIKDLRVLKNRSMENMLLVDNAAYSYYFQLQNGIPIIPYYDDKKDKELLILLNYLKQIIAIAENQKSTLKQVNNKYFRFGEYSKFEDAAVLIEQIYTKKQIQK